MSGKDNHVEAGCFAERRGEKNENYPDGSGTKGAVSDHGTNSKTCNIIAYSCGEYLNILLTIKWRLLLKNSENLAITLDRSIFFMYNNYII